MPPLTRIELVRIELTYIELTHIDLTRIERTRIIITRIELTRFELPRIKPTRLIILVTAYDIVFNWYLLNIFTPTVLNKSRCNQKIF